MKNQKEVQGDGSALRRKAEEALKVNTPAPKHAPLSPAEIQAALHDLKVHQVELEMQNEELRRTQEELEASRESYFDLYDLAPVGYCTLNKQGIILQANLTLANLLGVTRDAVIKRPLSLFITEEDQDTYYLYLKQMVKLETPLSCALRMVKSAGTACWMHLVSTSATDTDGTPVSRVVISDITERKQAEDFIGRLAHRFQSMLGKQLYGILVVSSDNHVEFVNQIFCDFMCLRDNPDELVGLIGDKIIEKILPAYADPDAVLAKIKKFVARGESVTNDEVLMRDGRVFLVDFQPLIIDGENTGRMWIHHDITERKRAEEKIRNNQIMLARTEGITHVGSWEWDITSDTVSWSEELFRIFQRDPQEGAPNFAEHPAIYHPDDMARLQQCVETAITDGTPYEIEVRAIRKDGETRICIARGVGNLSPGKRPTRLFGSLQDITERKQGQTALEKSHALLSNLTQLVPGGVYQYRLFPDGRSAFPYSSPGMNDIYEYAPEEVREDATPVFGRLHPDDYDMVASAIQESARTLQEFYCEFRVILPRQGLRWRWSQAHPERTDDGGTLWHGIISDITERKIAEAENHQLRNKAEMSSRLAAVGEMAAGIAHEINNPLTSVIGFSELLMESEDVPVDIKEQLKIIGDGSHRVKDIVKRMLTFARQAKPVKTCSSINELLDATLGLRAYVLRTANIEVVKHLDPELPLITVDPGQMQQVFLNLIVNAEYAMKKAHGKGTCTITTESVRDHIRILIKDDGMGMDKEILKKIFNPFFTTKQVGEGTGLGLSLSRSIILEHGGTIEVESEPGKGATFIITLPITSTSEEASVKDASSAPALPAKIKSDRILVVDDEVAIRGLVKAILEKAGHVVDFTGDATIAFEKLGNERYDAILMDIRMPGMSGMEMYEKITKAHPELTSKFIFMTGDTSDTNTRDFLEKNNLCYLTKPFGRETLLKKVNGLL